MRTAVIARCAAGAVGCSPGRPQRRLRCRGLLAHSSIVSLNSCSFCLMLSAAGQRYLRKRSLCATSMMVALVSTLTILTDPYPAHTGSIWASGNTSRIRAVALSRSCPPPSHPAPYVTLKRRLAGMLVLVDGCACSAEFDRGERK